MSIKSIINPKYYHGGPCKNCGGTLRYKSSRTCIVCSAKYAKQWKKDNHEKLLSYQRAYRKENRDKVHARTKHWKKENPEHQREWNRKNKSKRAEFTSRWSKNNRDKVNINKQRRYARKHGAKSESYNF